MAGIFSSRTALEPPGEALKLETLDHVALWVPNRDELADALTARFGMHVIERTEKFTLVGGDARRGKMTLFEAEGPRERGALKHVAFRGEGGGRAGNGLPPLALGEEASVVLVEGATDGGLDLDHVALFSQRPEETAREYESLGFKRAGAGAGGAPRVEVGGAFVEFHEGEPGEPTRPLLHHVAVLVDSADAVLDEAVHLGLDVADVVDAPNTYAVFVWGPERVKIEYVEHKPSFSLV